MDRELNPKQQTSEAIRAAESILIITGQGPTVDQVTSVVALGEILRKLGKKTHTLVSDPVPSGARFLTEGRVNRQLDGLRDFIMQLDLSGAEVDKLKYTIENGKLNVHITPYSGGFSRNDVAFTYGEYQYDLVISIGVATYSRLEKLFLQNAEMFRDVPLINVDFHRVNENYGAINLLDTNAASLSEMLVALAESLQTGIIDEPIASLLLTGIMASTDRFTANHTTAKALTVAAQMVALGADHQKVVRGLYQAKDKPRHEQPRRAEAPKAEPAAGVSNPQPHKQMIAGGVLQRPEVTAAEAAPVVEPAPAVSNPIVPVESFTQQATPQIVEQPHSVDHIESRPDNVIEMLPPSHIEMEFESPEVHPSQLALTSNPEPLINDAGTVQNSSGAENSDPKGRKAVNPANNPLLMTS